MTSSGCVRTGDGRPARLLRASARAGRGGPRRSARSRRRSPPRSTRSGPTSCITSRRPRSRPTPGSGPGLTLAAIAGATATLLEAVRELQPRDARVRGRVGRDVRRRAREPPARGHAVPAADAVRDREARRAPARRPAPRSRRPVRLLGDPLQPRVRAAPRALRLAEDHARRRRDQARSDRPGRARRPERGSRLVVRRRHHAGRVADAPAGRAGRLRAGERRRPHGGRARRGRVRPRRPGAGAYVRVDSQLVRPPETDRAGRRRQPGAGPARVAADASASSS